jgi:hypothetical protein
MKILWPFSNLRSCRGAALLAILATVGLSGCAYKGGIDQPVKRKLSWFSYLEGQDIRASCGPGQRDRYRLVYNADYERQVRSYEVTEDGTGGAVLEARASRPVDLSQVRLNDLLAPWRWADATAVLSPADAAALRAAIDGSGFRDPAPVGLALYSAGFYWVASGCQDGQFHFNAWAWPGEAFERLSFPALLFAHDGTAVPVNPPHAIAGDPQQQRGRAEDRDEQRFTLTVRENGIGRLLPPL